MAKEITANERMEKIVSLCKRKGFIFQSSEIYGGINGFWDYGPLGTDLKRNVKDRWWNSMTRLRDDVVGLDATIIMHPAIWRASGHLDTFADPMSTCRQCKKLVRSDQVWEMLEQSEWYPGFKDLPTGDLLKWARGKGKQAAPGMALVKNPEEVLQKLQSLPADASPAVKLASCSVGEISAETQLACPYCGGDLTDPRPFNLMFKTHYGPIESDDNVAYLRPETAQAIFVQFKNVVDSSRVKVPFGIAQLGKAFRNEVTPRNYIFRSREFEQMELEFFIKPDEVIEKQHGSVATVSETGHPGDPQPNWGWQAWHKYWVEERIAFFESIGLPRTTLEEYWQAPDELAHYAKACVDILFKFPFGTQELEGIAARGDFDLSQHQKHSGKSQEYFDQEAGVKYIPHVIEPSAGADRLVLALICNAYDEETVTDEKGNSETRVVLRFHPRVAPVKVAVFPLLKNRPELVAQAKAVRDLLRPHMAVDYDEAGAIGRRYRRQDEVGTPYCLTIDFDTIGENGDELKGTVTLRDRDTMQQQRLKIDELLPWLLAKIG